MKRNTPATARKTAAEGKFYLLQLQQIIYNSHRLSSFKFIKCVRLESPFVSKSREKCENCWMCRLYIEQLFQYSFFIICRRRLWPALRSSLDCSVVINALQTMRMGIIMAEIRRSKREVFRLLLLCFLCFILSFSLHFSFRQFITFMTNSLHHKKVSFFYFACVRVTRGPVCAVVVLEVDGTEGAQ